MISPAPYKKRTYNFLYKQLREAQNKLEMRDWEITLDTSNSPPEIFLDDDNGFSVARCFFEESYLRASIWVSPKRAIQNDLDPLWLLFHELAHILQNLHNEETRCNIIARLLIEQKSQK